jgi:hypothetical protein
MPIVAMGEQTMTSTRKRVIANMEKSRNMHYLEALTRAASSVVSASKVSDDTIMALAVHFATKYNVELRCARQPASLTQGAVASLAGKMLRASAGRKDQ